MMPKNTVRPIMIFIVWTTGLTEGSGTRITSSYITKYALCIP